MGVKRKIHNTLLGCLCLSCAYTANKSIALLTIMLNYNAIAVSVMIPCQLYLTAMDLSRPGITSFIFRKYCRDVEDGFPISARGHTT